MRQPLRHSRPLKFLHRLPNSNQPGRLQQRKPRRPNQPINYRRHNHRQYLRSVLSHFNSSLSNLIPHSNLNSAASSTDTPACPEFRRARSERVEGAVHPQNSHPKLIAPKTIRTTTPESTLWVAVSTAT